MSKEKPEVGDVWVNKDMNIKIIIVRIDKYNGSFECLLYDIDNNFIYSKVFYFLTNCKYLGKSKVSIKELFDVMPNLTAKDVTNIMDITGCSMLACKHALIKFKGDAELALGYLMGGWID